ncbi:MAG: 4-hydroxy-3-methylbut-2-enyl diphosphate reductase [Lachnospiraceae bacterium]|nr:4-hydroxy-3-methylbut-2-enyl diphosphate reductase [Lachnospiraceae bacterium]
MPEIIVAKTAGFCFGVNRAIDMVTGELEKNAAGKTDVQVCTLGPIVHNELVTGELTSKGVRIIDSPDQPGRGQTVVIRAHGIAKQDEEMLGQRGFAVVDATCPFVKKIHDIVRREGDAGRTVIIVGNPDHPEVRGIAGRCSGPNFVIESFRDFKKMKLPLDKSYSLVAQTTFNYEKLSEIIDNLQKLKYDIRCFNTVCNATYERQREAASIAAKVDAMIVIGSRNSSNTRKLYDICKEKCNVTVLIQTMDDLTCADFNSVNSIGITAGASTPKHIIEEVQTYVRY